MLSHVNVEVGRGKLIDDLFVALNAELLEIVEKGG